jgi:phosphotransferase system HPr-like phosphotransfer protein
MVTAEILLDTVQKVKDFSSSIIKMEAECELVQGLRILDAKSIMGIFSLDLSKPIQLRIDSDGSDVPEGLKRFLVKNE